MKKFLTAIILFVSLPLSADYLFMADGTIVECSIVKQKALSVTVKKRDGKTLTLNGYEILRIRQTKGWEPAQWIRAADGTLYNAHVVDDTGAGIVLRRNLSSPEEVSIKKKGTVFLKGEAAAVSLTASPADKGTLLSWQGDGDYAVYVRLKGSDYHLVASAQHEYLLTGLNGSQSYDAVVAIKKSDGTESAPSGAVHFISSDEPPLPPSYISFRIQPGSGGGHDLSITWDGDSDSDGIVSMYNLYLCDGTPVKIGSTMRKEFVVHSVDPSALHFFAVSSVDDAGKESAKSAVFASRLVSSWSYSIQPKGIIPVLGMKKELFYGGGAEMVFVRNNCLIKGLGFGAVSGAFIFSGAGNVKEGDAIPLDLIISYGGSPASWCSLSASIKGGCWYLTMLDVSKKKVSSFSPASELLFSCSFDLTKHCSLGINAGYGLLYCRSSLWQYASAGCSGTFRLEW